LEDRGFSSVFFQIVRFPKSSGSRIAAIIGLTPLFRISGIERHQRQIYESLVQVSHAARSYDIETAFLYLSLNFIQVTKKTASIAVQNGLIDICIHALSAFDQGFGETSLQDLASQILFYLWFDRPEYRDILPLQRLAKQVWSLFSHERDVGNFIAGVRVLELLLNDDGVKYVKSHELIQLMCQKMKDFSMPVRHEVMKVCGTIMRNGDDEILNIFGMNDGFRYVLECLDALSDEMADELLLSLGNAREFVMRFVSEEEIMEIMNAMQNDCRGEISDLIDWFMGLVGNGSSG
jgi:hypothetical protein